MLQQPKLIELLRGEVDWIVTKCLKRNRSRRYETANGLAAAFSRDGNLLASCGADATMRLWPAATLTKPELPLEKGGSVPRQTRKH